MNLLFRAVVFGLGVSASLLPRTHQGVVAGLNTTNTLTLNATAYANKYDGTIGGFVPLAETLLRLSKAGYNATDAQTRNTSPDPAYVPSYTTYVNQTLVVYTRDLVDAYIRQKSKFKAAGIQTLLQNPVRWLKENATGLRDDMVKIVPVQNQATVFDAFNRTVTEFDRLLKAYDLR